MKVVLSIKPEFANKIFEGSKKFEFRRSIFKNRNVKSIIVYASSPVQKVIGEFEIGKIYNDDLRTLWKRTKEFREYRKNIFTSIFPTRIKVLQYR